MFSTQLVATARSYLYVRETSPNAGPKINDWLASLGLPPGNSWCAAAACAWIMEAAAASGTDVSHFKKSARALGLYEKNPGLIVKDPLPGDLVIWDHGGGLGHVAVLTDVIKVNAVLAALAGIAGNTSADGHSRNGTMVAEHPVSYPDPKIKGYLRIAP